MTIEHNYNQIVSDVDSGRVKEVHLSWCDVVIMNNDLWAELTDRSVRPEPNSKARTSVNHNGKTYIIIIDITDTNESVEFSMQPQKFVFDKIQELK